MNQRKMNEIAKYIFYKDIDIGKKSVDLIAKSKTEIAAEILIEAYIDGITYKSLESRFDDDGINHLLEELGDKYILSYSELYEDYFLKTHSEILRFLTESIVKVGEKAIDALTERIYVNHPMYSYLSNFGFESLVHTFCEILIDIGNPRALPAIADALKIIVEYNYELLEKLKKFGENAVPYLQDTLSHEKIHISTRDNIIDFIKEMKEVEDS